MCGAWRWWLPVLWQSLIEDSRKTNGKMTEEWWLTIDEAIGEWWVLIDEFWKEEREGKREIAREKGRVPKDKSRKWGNWRVQKNDYKWLLVNGGFWWTSSEYTSILVVMLILEISSENRDRRRKEKGRVEWQRLRCMIDECGLTNKSKETKTRIKPITRNYWWTTIYNSDVVFDSAEWRLVGLWNCDVFFDVTYWKDQMNVSKILRYNTAAFGCEASISSECCQEWYRRHQMEGKKRRFSGRRGKGDWLKSKWNDVL